MKSAYAYLCRFLQAPRRATAVICALMVCAPAPSQAFTVAVSPSRVEIPLTGRPTTHSLKVINYGTSATSLTIRVANFDLD